MGHLTFLFIYNWIELQFVYSGSLTEERHHTWLTFPVVLESSVVHHSEGEGGRVHSHLHSSLQVFFAFDVTGMVVDFFFVNLM